MVDVLLKTGRAKTIGIVKNFITNRAASRQAAFGHGKAHAVDLIRRDQNFGAAIEKLILHLLVFEAVYDLAGICRRKITIQQFHVRGRNTQYQEGKEHKQQHTHAADGHQARRSKTLECL